MSGGILRESLAGGAAVITGGASGIGAAIVRTFLDEGAAVAIFDVDVGGGGRLASELAARGSVRAYGVDVTDPANVTEAVAAVVRDFGGVAAVVNCAGINRFAAPEDIAPDEWRRILAINLDGPWNVCHATFAELKRRDAGRIVNVASVAGLLGIPRAAHYTSAKHGLVGLTRALAVDLGPYNVTVNCICPGTTLTPLVESATSTTFKIEAARRMPLGRLGRPEDIANAALFLASDAASWITGATLAVDGGMTACIRTQHWE
jgi:NAD(P)-dependent dehydrogenase (short-subunit alcohol dehydrogenase family)